jgi:putative transposase
MVEKDIRMLCEWKGCEVEELNVQEDHVHLMVSIPPKISVSVLMGTLKGKLAIKLFKSYPGSKKKPYWGNHFWAHGYFASTIGLDEDVIRRYVKYQENEQRKEENQGKNFGLFEST